jgi:hypothetical protein
MSGNDENVTLKSEECGGNGGKVLDYFAMFEMCYCGTCGTSKAKNHHITEERRGW